jgi:hypothetical protein
LLSSILNLGFFRAVNIGRDFKSSQLKNVVSCKEFYFFGRRWKFYKIAEEYIHLYYISTIYEKYEDFSRILKFGGIFEVNGFSYIPFDN